MRKLLLATSIALALLFSMVFTLQTTLAASTSVRLPPAFSWACISGGARLAWTNGAGNTTSVSFPGGASTFTLSSASGATDFLNGDGKYSVTSVAMSPAGYFVYLSPALGNTLNSLFNNVASNDSLGVPISITYPSITCSSGKEEPPAGGPINQWEADNGITRPPQMTTLGASIVLARFPNGDLYLSRFDETNKVWVQVLYVQASMLKNCVNNSICVDTTITIPGHASLGWRNVVTRTTDGNFKFEIYKPDGTLYASITMSSKDLLG